MAAAVASYSHDHFHSLPDLNSTRGNFLKLNSPKLIENVFKDFFIANGINRTFGLAIPHRHFNILPRQIISFSSSSELVSHEFRYSKGHKFEIGEKERAFVAKFKRLLNKKNVAGMFDLCEYPGDDFEGTYKITMFLANINLKPKDVQIGATDFP
ncbi:hypothetical protein BKA65DRAFT_531010 [Rhexocercosporidium sp. MPI-PUGE-AT-0058]|nr:hypothetical protein BKA65DRAFT_531010 [Rhexocercosporidium sp. MPI-PUGE-AT-0058]